MKQLKMSRQDFNAIRNDIIDLECNMKIRTKDNNVTIYSDTKTSDAIGKILLSFKLKQI